MGLEVKLHSFVTTTLAACEFSRLSWVHNIAFWRDAAGWDIHVPCCWAICSVLFTALWIHNAVSFSMKIHGISLYHDPSIERSQRRRHRNVVTWVKTCIAHEFLCLYAPINEEAWTLQRKQRRFLVVVVKRNSNACAWNWMQCVHLKYILHYWCSNPSRTPLPRNVLHINSNDWVSFT